MHVAECNKPPRTKPTVSVVIPCYKVSQWVRETLESVFAQTMRDYEVILVNDGSPDSREFYTAVEPFRDRVTIIEQPNTGPAGARNTGMRTAVGQFITFLDGDDIWYPDFLERQLERIRASEDLAVVYSDALLFGVPGAQGKTLMTYSPSAGDPDALALVNETCTVFTSFSLVRRSAVAELGGFDESMRFAEDFHLWVRMAMAGKRFDYTKEVLGRYRIRCGSQSDNAVRHYLHMMRALDYVAGTAADPDLRDAARHQWQEVYQILRKIEGKTALRNGDFEAARTAFAELRAPSWKVRVTSCGLRFLPAAASFGSRMWNGMLRVRSALS